MKSNGMPTSHSGQPWLAVGCVKLSMVAYMDVLVTKIICSNETMNVLKVTTEIELTLDIHPNAMKNDAEHN